MKKKLLVLIAVIVVAVFATALVACSNDKVEQFTITFDLNYDGASSVNILLVNKGDYIPAQDTPVREGYVFGGWFTDADCTAEYEFLASGSVNTVSGDITLYAKWTKDDTVVPTPPTPAQTVLSSISAKYNGEALYVGDELDKSKIAVTATYSNDTTATVTDFTVSGFDSETAGTKTVTISYTEEGVTETTTIEIVVAAQSTPVVTLVSIAAVYNGETLYVGDELDKSKIAVTATYSNDATATVTDFTVSGFDSETAGTKTVTVSYTEEGVTETTTIEIVVAAQSTPVVTLVSIGAVYNGEVLYVGDELDKSKIVVTATYSDDTTATVTEFEISGFDSETAGTKTVTISYTEEGVTENTTIDIVVAETVTVYFKVASATAWEQFKVYAYVEGSSEDNSWPGVAMTAVEGQEGWYSATIDAKYTTVVFNNGQEPAIQTENIELDGSNYYFAHNVELQKTNKGSDFTVEVPQTVETVTYYFYNANGWTDLYAHYWGEAETQIAYAEGQYVVAGSFNGWGLDGSVILNKYSDDNGGQYYFEGLALNADDQFKIRKVVKNSTTGELDLDGWYSYITGNTSLYTQDSDGNIVITTTGIYSIYIKPNDNNSIWLAAATVEGQPNVEVTDTYAGTSWPGVAMTPVEGKDGWYSVSVDARSNRIIFNGKLGETTEQTGNLVLDSDNPYYNNGVWENHIHTYAHDCSTVCSVEGCTVTRTTATEHAYDNTCDTDCNVCGETRTTEHSYSSDCDTTCNVCGHVRENTAAHTYADCEDTDCDKCGEIRTAPGHKYDNNCDATCNDCGATRTAPHTYSGDCDEECNDCHETRDVDVEHTYVNGECEVCGKTEPVAAFVGIKANVKAGIIFVGEEDIKSHITVIKKFDDDTTDPLPADEYANVTVALKVSSDDTTVAGTYTYVVTYDGKNAEVEITLTKKLTGITVSPDAVSVVYEQTAITGITVTASYDGAENQAIALADVTIGAFDSTSQDKFGQVQTITISYEENGITKTADISVTLTKTVCGIEATYIGEGIRHNTAKEDISLNDFEIKYVYTDGSKETVEEDATVSAANTSTVGNEGTVTISVGDYDYTVKNITIEKYLVDYTVAYSGGLVEKGEDIDLTAITVTANYSDESTEEVTKGVTLGTYDKNTTGQKTVSVLLSGVEAGTITVEYVEYITYYYYNTNGWTDLYAHYWGVTETPIAYAEGQYVVTGSFNGWGLDGSVILNNYDETTGERSFVGLALNAGDKFKVCVVTSELGVSGYYCNIDSYTSSSLYTQDGDGNIVITTTGIYSIYFKSNESIYIGTTDSSSTPNVEVTTTYAGTDWRGVAMTEVEGKDGWYSVRVDSRSNRIIFNGKLGETTEQTANLVLDSDNPYYNNGVWANHIHIYAHDCSTVCSVEGCTVTRTTETKHDYDNTCDTDCNVCGETRTIEHSYSSDCDTTCNVCGHVRENTAAHTYADCVDTDCDKCGEIRTAPGHTYTDCADADCNECGATRTAPGHKYTDCEDTDCNECGKTRTAPGHKYTDCEDTDCNECGATRTAPGHKYDNNCDATCNNCGATRTAPHTYSGDCDEYCNDCNEQRTAQGTHTYGEDNKCTVCGADKPAAKFVSITASQKDETAFVGDDIKSHIAVVMVYDDNSTVALPEAEYANVTVALKVSSDDTTVAGTYTYVVTYDGKNAEVEITLTKKLTGITVSETTLTINHKTDLNITVTASYDGADAAEVSGYTTNYDKNTVGTQTVTVSYTENGITETADITVTVIKVLTEITAEYTGATEIDVDEELDYSKLTVTAKYSDDSTATIEAGTNGYSVAFDSSTEGEKTATVSYGGKSTTFTVTVNDTEVYYYYNTNGWTDVYAHYWGVTETPIAYAEGQYVVTGKFGSCDWGLDGSVILNNYKETTGEHFFIGLALEANVEFKVCKVVKNADTGALELSGYYCNIDSYTSSSLYTQASNGNIVITTTGIYSIYFKSNESIYIGTADSSSTPNVEVTDTYAGTDWPGVAMTPVEGKEGWYSVKVDAEANRIIFNNGQDGNNEAKTADLVLNASAPYYDGAWANHIHIYAHDCSTVCSVDGCTVTRTTETKHAYDNTCDTDCNVCGETRTTEHAYSSDCDATCNVCGYVRGNTADHTYDNACDADCNDCGETRTTEHAYSSDCDATCNVCGYVRGNTVEHSYDNTCDTDCNVCGEKRTITHTYSGACDDTCNVCGAERTPQGTHTYGEDNKCTVCGADKPAAQFVSITASQKDGIVFVGDDIKSHIAVVMVYDDNSTVALPEAEYANVTVALKDSSDDTTVAGTYTYVVTYAEKTTEVEITLTQKLTGITVSPATITVDYGSDISITVTASYNGADAAEVSDYTTNYDKYTAGEQTVTVSYTENGITQTADITVTVDDTDVYYFYNADGWTDLSAHYWGETESTLAYAEGQYVLVGSFGSCSWGLDGSVILNNYSTDNGGQYYFEGLALNAGDKFKVCVVTSSSGVSGWYNNITGNTSLYTTDSDGNIVITTTGIYSIYFKPNDNNSIWLASATVEREPNVEVTTTYTGTTWPGVAMTAIEGKEGWYYVKVNAAANRIIFNGKLGEDTKQTGNLVLDSDNPYYNNGEWNSSIDAE